MNDKQADDRVVPPHCAALVFEVKGDGEMTVTMLLAEGTSGRLFSDGEAPKASQMAVVALDATRKAFAARNNPDHFEDEEY